MAGRPFGADDSSPVREPGNTSLLSTMLKPGLSGMPMRPSGPDMNTPMFNAEGPENYGNAYKVYGEFAKKGPYNTVLAPAEEAQFRQWLAQTGAPFDPNAAVSDYDMRGYWKTMQSGQVPQWKGGHFPDTYKTPYDTTFSKESMYATPNNPFGWQGEGQNQHLVNQNTGQLMFGNDPSSLIRMIRQMQILRNAGSPF